VTSGGLGVGVGAGGGSGPMNRASPGGGGGGKGVGGGLRKVVVHVRVDSQEEVLHDEEPVVAGDIPARLPATRRCNGVLPSAGVMHCEIGRERVHPIAIGERVRVHGFGDLRRHSGVQSREVAARVGARLRNPAELGRSLLDHRVLPPAEAAECSGVAVGRVRFVGGVLGLALLFHPAFDEVAR